MGAIVTTVLNTDSIVKAYYHFLPVKYYGNDAEYFKAWLKLVNVWITLPQVEDIADVYQGATEERNALINKANQAFYDIYNTLKTRGGYIAYPTKTIADDNLLDFNTFKDIQWKGINADYGKIAQNAKTLEALLKNSKKIEILTEKGTNLSFSVNNRKSFINKGIIDDADAKSDMFFQRWIDMPGGNINISAIENSAEGKVIIPKDRYNSNNIQNISFNVKAGKLLDYKAEKGEKFFFDAWNQYSGSKDMIAGFQIGLNPGLKVIEEGNAEYRPGNAAGMVYVWFGDNSVLGGNNKVPGGFSYWFPITKATVKIDGKIVVKDGVLML
jgi:aminopeptidase